ncbi:MAG: sulfatase [Bacteroidales bacterium]|nr:sulfatase [Bacteroidales bacterium]
MKIQLLKYLSLLFLASVLSISCSKKPDHYNVLFIAVDDLNDWVGEFEGYPHPQTPNIDKLASEAISFHKAYCPASVCNPSRASIMSGYRPSTSGVYQNHHFMRDSELLKDAKTMPQWFSQHGYHTTAMGKIFHHANGNWADTISWDDWHKTTGNGMFKHPDWSDSMTVCGMPINKPGQAHFDWGVFDIEKEKTTDYKTAKWAADFLQTEHDKPFFIGCGIFRPHLPWYVPKEYFDRFPLDEIVLPEIKEDDLDDVPPIGREMAEGLEEESDYQRLKKYNLQKEAVQAYLASSAYADDCVGVVLEALKNSKYKDNTIVVLWGDHGWHLGEKLHYRKYVLWEESCRVPFIIKVPGNKKNGSECHRMVNLIDLYPTLTELCNIPSNPANDGQSIVPLIESPEMTWPYATLTTMGYKKHTVRSEDWRYIQYPDSSEELYDHRVDPMEWTNLADLPENDSIKNELKKWLPEVNAKEIEKKDPKKW